MEEARHTTLKNYSKAANEFYRKVIEQNDTNISLIDSFFQKVKKEEKRPIEQKKGEQKKGEQKKGGQNKGGQKKGEQKKGEQKKGGQKPLIIESTFPEEKSQEPTCVDLYGDGCFKKPKKKERYTALNSDKEFHHKDKYFEYVQCNANKQGHTEQTSKNRNMINFFRNINIITSPKIWMNDMSKIKDIKV